MSEVVQRLDGTVWIFAVLLVGWVVVQSILYLRHAFKFNKEHNLVTNDEIKKAFSAGIAASIGPAVGNVFIAIPMIMLVGGGLTFMRCGVIGSPMLELTMANVTASSLGVALGGEGFTESHFIACMTGMMFASLPFMFICCAILPRFDKLQFSKSEKSEAASEKKERYFPHFTNACMIGIMTYMLLTYLTSFSSAVAVVVGFCVSWGLVKLAARTGKNWIDTWSMPITLVITLTIAQLSTMIGG